MEKLENQMSNVKEAYNVVFVEEQDPMNPKSTRHVLKSIYRGGVLNAPLYLPTLNLTIPMIAEGPSLRPIKNTYKWVK